MTSRNLLTALAALAAVTLGACTERDAGLQDVRAALIEQLRQPQDQDRAIAAFYARRDHEPFWTRANDNGGDAAAGPAQALLEQLRSADARGLPRAPYKPESVAAQLGLRMDPTLRAQTEIALSRVYLRYAGDVTQGHTDPADVDGWLIPRRPFDPAQALILLDEHGVDDAIEALEPRTDDYRRLVAARRELVRRIQEGGWETVQYEGVIEPGEQHPVLPKIRQRLLAGGELARDESGDDPQRYDEATVAAVKDFQRRHGIADDGVLGPEVQAMLNVSAEQRLEQVDWNLERLRWLPDPPQSRHVAVNLAGFRLRAFDGDEVVLSMPVIVGKERHATPAFADEIEYLQINPYWNVPDSIIVNEIAPKVVDDPDYLRANDMEVVREPGPNAESIDPAGIDWAGYAGSGDDFPYLLRQRPGPKNALGRIKFMFPNRHAIYLHDTPAGHLFDEVQRTFSHGCIRVRDPVELADYLLDGQPDWDAERVREAVDGGERSRIALDDKVPVRLYYLTAWVEEDDERISFRRDIYGHDERLRARVDALRQRADAGTKPQV